MSGIKKQFMGYDKQTVDNLMIDYENQINKLKNQISSLNDELDHLKEQNSLLQHRVNITEKTNEEIARLALKEAFCDFILAVGLLAFFLCFLIRNLLELFFFR